MRYRCLTLFGAGLAALYVAERTLHGALRGAVDAVAGALLLAALVLAALRLPRADAGRRRALAAVLRAYALALLGAGVYALGLLPAAAAWPPRLRLALTVAWPALVALGLLPAVAMELAVGSMRRAPTLELWRVALAARAARVLVLAAIAFAGVNYAASVYSRKIDLSYFRAAQLGGEVAALARSLTAPLHVVLFFPPGNEVLELVRPYAEALAAASPEVQLEVLDLPLEPERARALGATHNGVMVLATDAGHEALELGLDADAALTALRNLDAEVRTRLLRVLRPARVAYITTGHAERDVAPAREDTRPGIASLRTLLTGRNFTVRRLGLAEGLGREVPSDAALLVVPGPTAAFAPNERAALHRYLARGGRTLIALDPERGPAEDALLAPLGVRVGHALVASEQYTVRVEGHGESPYDLITSRAGTHPAVATLARGGGRLGFVLLGAGAVSALTPPPADVRVTLALHAMPGSWEDANGNRRRDAAGEPAGQIGLMAAVEGPAAAAPPPAGGGDDDAPTGMRAVVLGDADCLADNVLVNMGNLAVLHDSLRWLTGEERWAGSVASEADVPLIRRKEDDTVWFYGVSILVPAAVLAAGIGLSRRRERPRRGGGRHG